MAIIPSKNTWGIEGGLEVQRSDLWVVDLTEVWTILADDDANTSSNVSAAFLPDKFDLGYYCTSVSLPEIKVQSQVIYRDSNPYHMPAYDAPLDSIRMTFLLDVAPLGAPKIYSLLESWRNALRSGRGSFTTSKEIEPQALDLSGAINRGIPEFKATISLYLVKGVDVRSSRVEFNSSAASENSVEVSASLILAKCWISSFQLSELNYTSSAPATVSAQIYAESILSPATSTLSGLRGRIDDTQQGSVTVEPLRVVSIGG